jgi:hypothetical protein
MRARGSESGSKTRPQNCQKLENLLGKSGYSLPETQFYLIVIQFFSLAFQFSSTLSNFPQRLSDFCRQLSAFCDAFLLSAMPFCFPQRLSAFRNTFLLFATAFQFSLTAFQFSSMAFHFPRNPRKSIYGDKYTKDRFSSFVFPATCSPSYVVHAIMSISPPTHSCGAPVFPTVHQT